MDRNGRELLLEKLAEFKPYIDDVDEGEDVRDVSINVGNRYVTDFLLEKLKELDLAYDPDIDPQPNTGPKLDYMFGFLARRAFELSFVDMATAETKTIDEEQH